MQEDERMRVVEEKWSSIGLDALRPCKYCGGKYVFEHITQQVKRKVPTGAKDLNLHDTIHSVGFRCSKCGGFYECTEHSICQICRKKFKDGDEYKAAAVYEGAAMNAPGLPLFLLIGYSNREDGCTNCVPCALCKQPLSARPIKRFYRHKIYSLLTDDTHYHECQYYHEDCATRVIEEMKENDKQQREAKARSQRQKQTEERERLMCILNLLD